MRHFYLFLMLLLSFSSFGQYYTKHYIAPAPWQYWSTANEIVIGTLSETPVQVTLKKSDGTLITDQLSVTVDAPIHYIFEGQPFIPANAVNQLYTDRGLIVEATHPVLVNLRNIDSDQGSNFALNIKGNASLVSFGDEGKGLEFRVGYYRVSTPGNAAGNTTGLYNSKPVYSVMATEDDTEVVISTATPTTITLNEGESQLFYAPIGTLVKADKPVVMNTGNWGDTPYNNPISITNGQDGTFDQIAPNNVLGTKYLVVRGPGFAATQNQKNNKYGGEQTTVVATQDNTTVTVVHYNADGTVTPNAINPSITQTINAGEYVPFYHGDAQYALSSSLIETDKPVIVYSGTEVESETDISTVLPIGGCAGAFDIQTRKFIDYSGGDLPYSAFCIIEDPTEPVLVNGVDVETYPNVAPRVAIGDTGFYLINFSNKQIGNPTELVITSALPLTTSIVQLGGGFSMSAFFSSFGQPANPPVQTQTNPDCSVTIEADPDYEEYVWFLNGEEYKTTTENSIIVTESGNYSVQVMRPCGLSGISSPSVVDVVPCSDLSVTKETTTQHNLDVTFTITVTNLNPLFTEPNAIVTDVLPSGYTYVSSTPSVGTYDENTGIWTIGNLAPDQIETLVMNCTIETDGDYVNVATTTGDLQDNNLANNKDSATIDAYVADLDAIKDDGKEFYNIGGKINYTIKVTNKGPEKAINVKVFDPMPHETTEMSWSGNNKNGTGDLLDFIDELEVGQEILYEVTLRVPKTHFGAFTNTVEVTSANVTDPNPECTSCSDTDLPEFNIPKGISPNGDGDNDYLDLEGYFISKITIFNRYGKEVYSKNDYVKEWYGQDNNGKLLPAGTYFYTVEVQGEPYKSGYVHVIRELK